MCLQCIFGVSCARGSGVDGLYFLRLLDGERGRRVSRARARDLLCLSGFYWKPAKSDKVRDLAEVKFIERFSLKLIESVCGWFRGRFRPGAGSIPVSASSSVPHRFRAWRWNVVRVITSCILSVSSHLSRNTGIASANGLWPYGH